MLGTEHAQAILDGWWPYVVPLLPFIQAFFVKAGAGRYFKVVMAVVLAAAATVLSVVGTDWDSITFELLVTRTLTALGGAWLVYQAASRLVSGWEEVRGNNTKTSLDDFAIFLPHLGFGRAKPSAPAVELSTTHPGGNRTGR